MTTDSIKTDVPSIGKHSGTNAKAERQIITARTFLHPRQLCLADVPRGKGLDLETRANKQLSRYISTTGGIKKSNIGTCGYIGLAVQ